MNQDDDMPSPLRRRVVAAIVAAPCVAMLAVGACLTPCESGYGTAEQLGMRACGAMVESGWPCPSCGMTTAVSAAVHGQVTASLRAHPFGMVLALAAATLGCAALVQTVTARDVLGRLRFGWWWLAAAVAGMLLGWGVVLAVGAADGTLPRR